MVQLSAGERESFLLQNILVKSEAHPTSCAMDSMCSFQRDKVAGA